MKVIFLDIDGVLNSMRSVIAYPKSGLDHYMQTGDPIFDPVAIKLLKRFVSETGVKVVVHSSWRDSLSNDEFEKILKVPIMGQTPRQTPTIPGDKSMSLATWLGQNRTTLGIENYVVLDDYPIKGFESAQVVVDSRVGLTLDDLQRARDILNVEWIHPLVLM